MVLQLAQIPKMSVPKGKVVAQLYPNLLAFVHAVELDAQQTWRQLKELVIPQINDASARKLGLHWRQH